MNMIHAFLLILKGMKTFAWAPKSTIILGPKYCAYSVQWLSWPWILARVDCWHFWSIITHQCQTTYPHVGFLDSDHGSHMLMFTPLPCLCLCWPFSLECPWLFSPEAGRCFRGPAHIPLVHIPTGLLNFLCVCLRISSGQGNMLGSEVKSVQEWMPGSNA